MHDIIPYILWAVIIAVFLVFFFGGRLKKKNYKGQSMEITRDWYETSQSMYSSDDTKKAYYFQYDKNYLTQGHYMVDQNKQTIYEAKILFGDAVKGFEMDMTNHLLSYKHHHKISASVSTDAFADGAGIAISSYFKFDGENIWEYLKKLGYNYHFKRIKLAYQIDVAKDGHPVGTIYSSNNGKNYFGCQAPFAPKMGGNGFYIVECADRDMDAMFLLAMAFARTELSTENLK